MGTPKWAGGLIMAQSVTGDVRRTDPMFREFTAANYLVDFFSRQGVLFRSERIVANNDIDAEAEARALAVFLRPASFKITRLKKTGSNVVYDSAKSMA